MNICRLTRPALDKHVLRFPQREHHILSRLARLGHNISHHVIHPLGFANQYVAYGLGFLASLMRFNGRKPDVILADNIESGIAAATMKMCWKIPFVMDFIDDYAHIARYDGFRLRYYAIRFFEKWVLRFADLVIVVDKHKARFCRQMRVKPQRIALVPNGTDTRMFSPSTNREHLPAPGGSGSGGRVLFIGKLNRYYNLDLLIQAFPMILSEHPDTKFVLAGDGDDMEYLTNLTAALQISKAVAFLGYKPPREIPALIASADVCLFPLPDSSALAIYEYLSCGKPVVVPDYQTDKMGVREDILPDQCVFKTPHSPAGIAEAVNRLLSDTRLRIRISHTARKWIEASYDWNQLAREYEAALLSACRFECDATNTGKCHGSE